MTHAGGWPALGCRTSDGGQGRLRTEKSSGCPDPASRGHLNGTRPDDPRPETKNPSTDDWRVLTGVGGSSGCEALWSSHPPDCNQQCEEHLSWKREVALDVTIDVGDIPVIVRLAGMLEEATALDLEAVFAELISDGHREFKLETSALGVPDECGVGVLFTLHRLAQNAGGDVTWDGLTVNHPFPTGRGDLGRRAGTLA